MNKRPSPKSLLLCSLFVLAAFGLSWVLSPVPARALARQEFLGRSSFTPVPVSRTEPLHIEPLYNRPDLVSDENLAAVLKQVQPPFDRHEMKPNHVEHALRTWGVTATFQIRIVSGEEMLRFLTDNASYIHSWGERMRPLLEERPQGISIRYGTEAGASYHHDHWLACVTEAGAPLSTPVFAPSRRGTLGDVLQEALRDFRLDERETEWTAMAFGLWIPPVREWTGSDGRHYSFDLLVDRLRRGQMQTGVCAGTHRVYSLMLLVRLDDEFDILSDSARERAWHTLEDVRDRITASQLEDGHWPSNWPDGAEAVSNPITEDLYKKVIATGHHLEWLSIAPPELHPPEEQIRRAIDWVVQATTERTREEIRQNYTFFSHVGSALCNWRQVRPADFWRSWEADHPWTPADEPEETSVPAASDDSAAH